MLAIWLENNEVSLRDNVLMPKLLDDEVLIRILRAGICNTDISLINGYYPFTGVIGHEFVGVVDSGPNEWIGKTVVSEINVGCGICPYCINFDNRHCENRTTIGIKNRNGAFAEYLSAPLSNLYIVPESLSLDQATFVEPLAAALQIQSQISIESGVSVMVLGAGKLGQLIARSLSLTNCDLHVFDRNPDKLELLSNNNIDTSSSDCIPKKFFDIAIECTGSSDGFNLAYQSLRPKGKLVMKSTYPGNLDLDISQVVVDEITLIGSRCGPFDLAIEMLNNGSIQIEDLIDCKYSLNDGLLAIKQAKKSGMLKVLLEM